MVFAFHVNDCPKDNKHDGTSIEIIIIDDFIVFDDTAKDNYFAITNASNGKALFAKNDSCTNLYGNDWNYCPFDEFAYSKAEDKVKVGFYFAPYQYIRDNPHYKIFVFEDTIQAIV